MRHVSSMLISILQACIIRPERAHTPKEYPHDLLAIVLVDHEYALKKYRQEPSSSCLLDQGRRVKKLIQPEAIALPFFNLPRILTIQLLLLA